MGFSALLSLAFGLSMDAAAVSATRGLLAARVRVRDALLVALCFGGFQALMPLIGYVLGSALGPWLRGFGHGLAALLLAGIGAKMLWEALTEAGDVDDLGRDPFAPRTLIALGIATSLDALAAGLSLPLLGAPLGQALVTIGLTTAGLCTCALYAGRRFGQLLGRRLDALGGAVLLVLAAKVALEALGQG
jgi:manganese efflux pump family protein